MRPRRDRSRVHSYIIRSHDPRSIIAYNAPHVTSFRKLSRTIIRSVSNERYGSRRYYFRETLCSVYNISCGNFGVLGNFSDNKSRQMTCARDLFRVIPLLNPGRDNMHTTRQQWRTHRVRNDLCLRLTQTSVGSTIVKCPICKQEALCDLKRFAQQRKYLDVEFFIWNIPI